MQLIERLWPNRAISVIEFGISCNQNQNHLVILTLANILSNFYWIYIAYSTQLQVRHQSIAHHIRGTTGCHSAADAWLFFTYSTCALPHIVYKLPSIILRWFKQISDIWYYYFWYCLIIISALIIVNSTLNYHIVKVYHYNEINLIFHRF